jgi:hypothetical protein
MTWKDLSPWVAKIAPMLGTALGGPMGGAAGALLASALGTPGATPDAISQAITTGTLTGDQLLTIKKAEQEFTLQMKQADINSVKDLEALAVEDRKSAREREVTVKDWTPRILGYGVTAGFFGLLAFLIKHEVPPASRDLLNIMLGTLGSAWVSVMTYYFGSSAGSRAKDTLIANSTPNL